MFYLLFAIGLFSIGLTVALYKKPLPNRLSRLVQQMDREKLAHYHRKQSEYFETNMRD